VITRKIVFMPVLTLGCNAIPHTSVSFSAPERAEGRQSIKDACYGYAVELSHAGDDKTYADTRLADGESRTAQGLASQRHNIGNVPWLVYHVQIWPAT